MPVQRHKKTVYWWSCGREGCAKEHATEKSAHVCSRVGTRKGCDILMHYRRWRAHQSGKSYAEIARAEKRTSGVIIQSCKLYVRRARVKMPMSAARWNDIVKYGTSDPVEAYRIRMQRLYEQANTTFRV